MRSGEIVFTRMDRVIFGKPVVEAVAQEIERLNKQRVFILASRTLNRETELIRTLVQSLGDRCVGVHDDMPAHSPRSAVVACANAAREAGADLLLSYGGGSVTDGGKAVTICLEHNLRTEDDMEPFRSVVEDGQRRIPSFRAPSVRQIVIPTTLSGGEFNARAGVTDTRVGLKQSFIHPGIIPETVILDPAVTVHTPQWLWISTGVRAVDHAVETLCSLDANHYTDGTARQALSLLSKALPAVKSDPANLSARLDCLMGAWLSMVGIVTGTRLGASHAIGHILGGSAGVAHGHTSCIMLPYVMAYNFDFNSERQALVAEAMQHAGARAADVLDDFIRGLGMPRTLREVGVEDEQLPQLAQNCMLDDWTFSNPKPIREPEQVLEILRTAL